MRWPLPPLIERSRSLSHSVVVNKLHRIDLCHVDILLTCQRRKALSKDGWEYECVSDGERRDKQLSMPQIIKVQVYPTRKGKRPIEPGCPIRRHIHTLWIWLESDFFVSISTASESIIRFNDTGDVFGPRDSVFSLFSLTASFCVWCFVCSGIGRLCECYQ